MTLKKSLLLLPGLLSLAACTIPAYEPGQYWQRRNPSEQVYQQGPKAEQMVKRDIGRCNYEIEELKSLGVVNDPILTDPDGRVLETDEFPKKYPNLKNVPKYDITRPPNDRTFHTFDECMQIKGWERVMKLPHAVKPKEY